MKTENLLFIVAALAIVVMGAVLALAVTSSNGSHSQGLTYVTVSATGTASGLPTNATIYIMMNATGSTLALASANLSQTLTAFNGTVLKYVGGNLSRITTTSYVLSKIYNQSNYSASETVSVSLSNADNISPALGALSVLQNTYINGVTSQLSSAKTAQLTQQAIAIAMQNATAQAQAVAGSYALSVNNVTISKPYLFSFAPGVAYSSAPYGSSGFNQTYYTGQQSVQEQVSVVFTYK